MGNVKPFLMAVRDSSWSWLGLVLAACAGSQSAQVGLDAANADRPPPSDEAGPAGAATAQAPEAPKAEAPKDDPAKPSGAVDDAASAPPAPALDPLLVQKTVDVSAEQPADGRTRLGLRLAAVAQGPDEPWLLAVVNRGTEP